MADATNSALSQSLVDGVPESSVPLDDRGLLYGDGLFETIKFELGCAPLWRWHMQRLALGCELLSLEFPGELLLKRECAQVAGTQTCVVRLVLTRGSGLHAGYASHGVTPPRRLITARPAPPPMSALTVGICQQTLADAGVTAQLKHLSRLEQVLLAREMSAGGWDEGLVFDRSASLCETLQSNVLLTLKGDGRWVTPPVGSGVAGTARAALLEFGLIEERGVKRNEMEQVAAMALCNAVRGVMPVAQILTVGRLDMSASEALATDWRALLADLSNAGVNSAGAEALP